MADACSTRPRNLPGPTTRSPSSQDSECSWTSTIAASPASLSTSESSDADDEDGLEGTPSEGTASVATADRRTESLLMVGRTLRESNRPSKGNGSVRPRKASNAAAGEPLKRNLRVKTGCHTCRKRKKKCDEAKPECKSGRTVA